MNPWSGPSQNDLAMAQNLRREGLTYPQIAARLGVSRRTAFRWVNNRRPFRCHCGEAFPTFDLFLEHAMPDRLAVSVNLPAG